MHRRLLIVGAACVAIAIVILLALPAFSMLQPEYYRRYPALGARMDHWAQSTHAKVRCGQCHIEPGISGFVRFSARAVPAFYSQLATGSREQNLLKAPKKAACQKCHTTYRSVSPGGDLLIPHRAHVQVLKMECVTCHKNLVHSLDRRGFNRPEMETCLTCHDGDRADDACTSCHVRKKAPASHSRADWLKIHGSFADTIDCAQCHDWTPGYCAECHQKRPASHKGNWKTGHAAPARARGEGCLVCHGGQPFCDRCH